MAIVNGKASKPAGTPVRKNSGAKAPKDRGVEDVPVPSKLMTETQLEAGLIMETHVDAALVGASFPYKGGGINLTFHIPEVDKWQAAHLVDFRAMALHIVVFRPPLYDEMSEYGEQYVGEHPLVQREDFDRDYRR